MIDFSTHRTVAWDNGKVVFIDQTKLPGKVSYARCSSYHEVADCIRKMVVRGAPAIGVAAAMGVALAGAASKAKRVSDLISELQTAIAELRQTRPTAVNLFWGLDRMLAVAQSAGKSVAAMKDALVKEAIQMADQDVQTNRRLGKFGAELLEDGDVVLTHCRWPN